jgi:hypothetical protein
MDLNLLPPLRKLGVTFKLLDINEKDVVTKSDVVGIGVGLYRGYVAAQKIYVNRGYVSDSKDVTLLLEIAT